MIKIKKNILVMCAVFMLIASVQCESYGADEVIYPDVQGVFDIINSWYDDAVDFEYIVFECEGYVFCCVGSNFYCRYDEKYTEVPLQLYGDVVTGHSSLIYLYSFDVKNGEWVSDSIGESSRLISFVTGPSNWGFGIDNSGFVANILECSMDVLDPDGNVVYSATGEAAGEYDSTLGYLSNVVLKKLTLTDTYGNVDLSTVKYVLSFADKSTTGIDLTTGEYFVRVYQSMCYYNKNSSEVYDDFYPLIYFSEFPIENNSISYNGLESFANVTSNTEDHYSAWDKYVKNLIRSDNVYYQIVKKDSLGNLIYSGYLKLSFPPDQENGIASTLTPDLNIDIDNGGYSGNGVDVGAGTGTNYDDAGLNADNDLLTDDYSAGDLISGVTSLLSFIGSFPAVIASVFSFLPPWVQTYIGAGFALLVGILIYKAVRG